MECSVSKFKIIGLFGLTCVLVAVSYFCTTLPNLKPQIAGWLGIAFFGLGFIVFPVQFFRTRPQIVINDNGIEDRRTKMGVIRWEDVVAISIRSIRSTRFLCIELVEPERFLSRLSRWQQTLSKTHAAMGFSDVTITFSGLSPGIDEAWVYIQGRNAAQGRIQSS